jgi:organic radical activating enzyme
MRVSSISSTWLDYPDNYNLATILYTVGCDIKCKGCQNQEFQSYDNPKYPEVTVDSLYNTLKAYTNATRSNKVVLEGGEPLSKYNIDCVREFLLIPDFDFCVYTGYSIDYVIRNGISGAKFYKCGAYIGELKDTRYPRMMKDSYFHLVTKSYITKSMS